MEWHIQPPSHPIVASHPRRRNQHPNVLPRASASRLPPSSSPCCANSHRVPRLLCQWLKGKHEPSSWPCHHRRSWPRPWRRSSCRPSWAASAQHRGEPTALSRQRTNASHGVWGALTGLYPQARPGTRCGHSVQKRGQRLAGQHIARMPEWRLRLRAAADLSRRPEPRPKPAVCGQGHQADARPQARDARLSPWKARALVRNAACREGEAAAIDGEFSQTQAEVARARRLDARRHLDAPMDPVLAAVESLRAAFPPDAEARRPTTSSSAHAHRRRSAVPTHRVCNKATGTTYTTYVDVHRPR